MTKIPSNVIKELGKFYSGQTKTIKLSKKAMSDLEHTILTDFEPWDAATDFFVSISTNKPSKEKILGFMLETGIGYNIQDLAEFKDLHILLVSSSQNLIHTTKFILKNNIKDLTFEGRKPTFKDLEEIFSDSYFEDWRSEESIKGGSLLVQLCDHLKIKVKTLANSPKNWDIEESEFSEEYQGSKQDLINFSRLFKKPIDKWYPSWTDKYIKA